MSTSIISKPARIASVDIFRALTMFLMIFVNDFWTISNVPHWLEHAAFSEDLLGFSDIVFPSFLFILGMSIPLAIESRMYKKESKGEILKHIIIRSVALLVMGLFTVNREAGISSEIGMGKPLFTTLMLIAFFLIWNVYPKVEGKKKLFISALKITGWLLLIILALIYRDPQGGFFQPRWWGILGLIGWTYLICAILYLYMPKNWKYMAIAGAFFVLMCIAASNHWLGIFHDVLPGNGCFHAFTMAGVLLTLLFKIPDSELSRTKKLGITATCGIIALIAGTISHSFWIISKLQATPTWLFFCIGISLLAYIFIYWLTDMQGKASWFNIIKPAGTATLTCYILPYALYMILSFVPLRLPDMLTTGGIGLIKCALFSLMTIGLTALLVRGGIKLKI